MKEGECPEGRIIRGVAGFFDVAGPDGAVYRCRAKGTFRREGLKPLCGDMVTFEITHEGDREGNVTDVHPRRNEILRPPVANVDQALLIFAVTTPDISHYLLDRFLIMMRRIDLPVHLALNKCDLAREGQIRELEEAYAGCGSDVIPISVKTGAGLDALKDVIRGKTSVLAGPSGVGKSSLLNALMESTVMETGELSRKTARGKNTTRHSELFSLPSLDAFLCDTPGFMSLKPEGIKPRDLHMYYPEFEAVAEGCRYAGCTHLTEPGCAVKEALSEGSIAGVRYETYRLLYDELNGERPVYVKKIKNKQTV